MPSKLVKAIIDNAVIISAVESKQIVNKAVKIHGLSPVAAVALGRALTMAALMGKELKNKRDYLSATINGDGPLGKITVCADGEGHVKGDVINPSCPTVLKADGTLDVGSAVGKNGSITVVKDIGLKQPYVGMSKLINGEIAGDFAYYYAKSEQQPCGITLGVRLNNKSCKSAGGVFVQVMPDCPSELLSKIETIMYAMDEMSYQFDGSTAKEVISRFFGEFNPVFTEETDVVYKCDCSKRKIDGIVKSLGEDEAYGIVDEMGFIEIKCHFCGKKYTYDKTAVDKIFGNEI